MRELRQRLKAAQDQHKGRPRKNKKSKSPKKKVAPKKPKKVAKKKVETKEMATETEPIDDDALMRELESQLEPQQV